MEKITGLPQVTDKLYHIISHWVDFVWAGFELTTLVVIFIHSTDCIDSYKPDHHTITTTRIPFFELNFCTRTKKTSDQNIISEHPISASNSPKCLLYNGVSIVQKLVVKLSNTSTLFSQQVEITLSKCMRVSGNWEEFNVILTINNAISKNVPSSDTKMASNYDVHSSPPCNYIRGAADNRLITSTNVNKLQNKNNDLFSQ
jgi:hypothetical protein